MRAAGTAHERRVVSGRNMGTSRNDRDSSRVHTRTVNNQRTKGLATGWKMRTQRDGKDQRMLQEQGREANCRRTRPSAKRRPMLDIARGITRERAQHEIPDRAGIRGSCKYSKGAGRLPKISMGRYRGNIADYLDRPAANGREAAHNCKNPSRAVKTDACQRTHRRMEDAATECRRTTRRGE